MKNFARCILSFIGLFVASVALAGVPSMNVIVSDASGHGAFRGTTDADGTFRTGKLGPGNYIVQLKSGAAKGKQYLLVLSAGRKKVTADSVAGEKFAGGGVALRVPVSSETVIVGQLVTEEPVASSEAGNVRMILGRRYYWVANATGSNLGRWVEEGTPAAQNVVLIDLVSLQRFQDRAGEGSMANESAFKGF
jgi:hypothetical protein